MLVNKGGKTYDIAQRVILLLSSPLYFFLMDFYKSSLEIMAVHLQLFNKNDLFFILIDEKPNYQVK
ncbi:hypothetical protein, partial [Salinimicrobium oceani]|uniref:hypothetical protein n=1 Tax=Salinimicrobium oceani TaxID=2722702 RepID=UPI001ADDD468